MSELKKELPSFRVCRTPDSIEVEIRSEDALERYFERIYGDLKELESFSQPAPLRTASSVIGVQEQKGLEAEQAQSDDLPAVIAHPKGINDAILKILATVWGKGMSRHPAEIQKALKNCGYRFDTKNIMAALSYPFKRN